MRPEALRLKQAKQISLQPRDPRTLDVNGRMDSKGVIFLGDAVQQFDGTWRCLANVCGCLCLVEVTITPEPGATP